MDIRLFKDQITISVTTELKKGILCPQNQCHEEKKKKTLLCILK